MDRRTAEREAARIVREANEFAQENSGFPDEYVWFLVGVLQNEIAALLEGRHEAQKGRENDENYTSLER